MAKLQLLAGTTSKIVKMFVQDTSKTNGSGLTGLAFGTSGLTCYYIREGANTTTSVALQTATLGTWTTRGFIVVDATNMPGAYEFGIPDAAIAAGAKSVLIYFQGAANMAPYIFEIELTAVDNQSTTFGLAAIPISGTSTLTESYAAVHATPTLAQLLFEVRAILAENSITTTTMTTKKIDGSTTAHTYTLNDAVSPTALTTAS